ncbi:MAG: TetR/AcrR family transcriptional regulator [Myxococcales bacterium]|nr:TetR/AcrR family transcriptional regulator [Myxococcales bacterium]
MNRRALSQSLRHQAGRVEMARAAIPVFARWGADDTRIEHLLEATGVSRRTFYKYFDSKEDVLVALYEIATRDLLSALNVSTSTRESPSVAGAIDAYLDFHADNYDIARVLIEHAQRRESPLHPLRAAFRQQLCSVLSHAVSAASGRRLDPFLFTTLISGLEGLSMELLERQPSASDLARAKRVVNGLFQVVLKGAQGLPQDNA